VDVPHAIPTLSTVPVFDTFPPPDDSDTAIVVAHSGQGRFRAWSPTVPECILAAYRGTGPAIRGNEAVVAMV